MAGLGAGLEPETPEDVNCLLCKIEVGDGEEAIYCESCKIWFHRECLHMTREEFTQLVDSSTPWYCARCLTIKANKIKWGSLEGEENIQLQIEKVYKNVIRWRKNTFPLPRGKNGENFQ